MGPHAAEVYGASKAGLWGLTRCLASYWGKQGVRVNAVSVGAVASGQGEDFERNYCARVPLGRMAQAADGASGMRYLASASGMRYLASDASRYVSGHKMVVDGGRMAR
jgi:NAD(P)-dependent dehydrogenase (short-subunit alcohol dehydrogenase family)